MKRTMTVILCGLFIALQIVIGRILTIDTSYMRISFVFIPIALGGAVFGPFWNGMICMAADIIGFFTVPSASAVGPFFPGFTLNAFLSGFVCGFFFKAPLPAMLTGEPKTQAHPRGLALIKDMAMPTPATRLNSARSVLIRSSLAAVFIAFPINAILNTYWISLLAGEGFMVYFTSRLIKQIIMLPVNVAVFNAVWRSLGKYVESLVSQKNPI